MTFVLPIIKKEVIKVVFKCSRNCLMSPSVLILFRISPSYFYLGLLFCDNTFSFYTYCFVSFVKKFGNDISCYLNKHFNKVRGTRKKTN